MQNNNKRLATRQPNQHKSADKQKQRPNVKRSKNVEVGRFEYTYRGGMGKEFKTSVYILDENKLAYSLLKDISDTNPGAINFGVSDIDTMRGIINHPKYEPLKRYVEERLATTIGRNLKDPYVQMCFCRKVILLDIHPESLTHGIQAKELAIAIKTNNFLDFLRSHECSFVDNNELANDICPGDSTMAPTVAYFQRFSKNLYRRFNKTEVLILNDLKRILSGIYQSNSYDI